MNRTFENVLATLGMTIGLSQMESILGIIILVIQLIFILWRSGLAIYEKIKHKKLNDVTDILENTSKDIIDIYNQITTKKEDK